MEVCILKKCLPKTLLNQEISEGLLPSLMKVEVSRISMKDYELFYCDKEKLKVRW